jgi:hypothetical protein
VALGGVGGSSACKALGGVDRIGRSIDESETYLGVGGAPAPLPDLVVALRLFAALIWQGALQ